MSHHVSNCCCVRCFGERQADRLAVAERLLLIVEGALLYPDLFPDELQGQIGAFLAGREVPQWLDMYDWAGVPDPDKEGPHAFGCCCADCGQAELSAEND